MVPIPCTAVFDLGGTWFRSGETTASGALTAVRREPAITHRRHPKLDPACLQERLVDYLCENTGSRGAGAAVVSLGAALNGHSGLVLDSGPMWGPDAQPFDLGARLRAKAPNVIWTVVNDVTASLLHHVERLDQASGGLRRHGRTALVTVSSGIAARTFDFERRAVPLDARHGLQGEIGHLRVRCEWRGAAVHLDCDCGGVDHLNAFASGNGLARLVAKLQARGEVPQPAATNERDPTGFFAAALAGEAWANEVLDAAVAPLAEILRTILVHDPELDPIVLVGGVADSLGSTLVDAVCARMEADGMYQITERDPGYVRRRIRHGELGDSAGMLGCALVAAGKFSSSPKRLEVN